MCFATPVIKVNKNMEKYKDKVLKALPYFLTEVDKKLLLLQFSTENNLINESFLKKGEMVYMQLYENERNEKKERGYYRSSKSEVEGNKYLRHKNFGKKGFEDNNDKYEKKDYYDKKIISIRSISMMAIARKGRGIGILIRSLGRIA